MIADRGSRRFLGLYRSHWLLCGVLFCLTSPARSIAQSEALKPLPELDLIEGVEPTVVELFTEGIGGIEELLSDPELEEHQLAEAYGELGRAAVYYEIEELLVPCLENAQALAPEDFRWPYYLGAFFHDERRLGEAQALLERAHELDPDDRPTLVRLGRLALLEDQPERARAYFEQVSSNGDLAALGLYGLGRSAMEIGETESAIDYFGQALELQPNAAEIHQQLGLAYRKLRDLDNARRYLSAEVQGELVFSDPLMDGLKGEFMRSHVFAGVEAETSGRWEEAVIEYRKAVEAEPENGIYHQALANALREVGDLDGAVDEHREAVRLLPDNGMARVLLGRTLGARDGVTEEVLRLYESAVELAPDVKDTHLGLGRALQVLERYEEASEHFEIALQLEPENHTARLQWARVLMRLGQDERAAREIEKVVEAQPDRGEALLSYGQALGRLGKLEEAKVQLQRALELERGEDSTRAVAHAALGDVLEAEGAADEALVHYQAAVDLAPELEPLQLSLAGSLGRLGRYEEEVGVYEMILMLDPENIEAHVGKGRALAAAGRLAEATDLMETALSEEQEEARRAVLSFELAGFRQLAGNDEVAVELYQSVIDHSPNLRDAHFNLAVSLGRLGRTEEALRHLARAVEIDPMDEEAHLALGQALASEGRFAEARDVLEQGLEAAPQSSVLAGALAQLLIASPDPTVRDPARAVPLAMRVHEAQPTLQNAAMIAAALGAAGRFQEAADWQSKVVAQAEAAGVDAERIERMRSDLALYRERAGEES